MQNNNYSQVSESKIVDPVIQLLEDVRNRKIKVTIPDRDEIIPSIWNDRGIKKSTFVEVKIGDNSVQFDKPVRFPRIFQNNRSPDFPTAQQKILLKRLSSVPLYVVVTDSQEMIMATPREHQESNFFDWIYSKYYNCCVWTEDRGPISIALFFLDKEDASLYLQEIGKNDPKCTEKTNLHIQLTSLDVFYNLNRTSSPGTQAKLVADLDEIYKVLTDYIPKNLHQIHPKQRHSKTLYQGNPIYIVKTSIGREGYNKKLVDYKISDSETDFTRNIFFKLEDAYLAWDKFCSNNKQINLPIAPNIEIYNLESYLLDLEQGEVDVIKDNYFVATRSTFKNVAKDFNIRSIKSDPKFSKKVEKYIKRKSNQLIDLCKGMIWVLTSDTLPTEDNAW